MVDELTGLLTRAIALELPVRDPLRGVVRVRQESAPASVLVLFARHSRETSVLLTRRTETVEQHKGQIAFPGGVQDGQDTGPDDTALRETEEEVGIPRERVRVIGPLPPLPTLTGFTITPIVGYIDCECDAIDLKPNPNEIAETFWVPLSTLRARGTYRLEHLEKGAWRYPIHVYQVGPHRIWGATAAVLKNILDRLDRVRIDSTP